MDILRHASSTICFCSEKDAALTVSMFCLFGLRYLQLGAIMFLSKKCEWVFFGPYVNICQYISRTSDASNYYVGSVW